MKSFGVLALLLASPQVSAFQSPAAAAGGLRRISPRTQTVSTPRFQSGLHMHDPAFFYESSIDLIDTTANIIQASSSSMSISETSSNFLLAETAASLATNPDVWIFLAGIFPFGWATYEFWRRIAGGESFGTGTDSVVFTTIGEDGNVDSSRGARVLGKGALIVAYVLFTVAAAVLAVVLYTVITSDAPPADFSTLSSGAAPAVSSADISSIN